jgi:serine/threonine protein kinase/ActR/RegA family two-component response regulator
VATILVIEDEQAIRRNITEILFFEGYSTLEAENGRVGVETALRHVPDLIICDVMMPELDGYGVIRQLQSELPTAMIPFIFLTARADRKSMRYGMELGADDYISKPFTPDELVSAVRARFRKQAVATDTYNRIVLDGEDTYPIIPENKQAGSLIGETIRGYQIWELIGEGGAGSVYKAYQGSLGRHVAIKVLKQTYAQNVEFVHRFQTEAELVARLEHPHIIPLYDYWHDSNNMFLVMRYVRGGSLRDSFRQRGRWSIAETSVLLDHVTAALSVAHQVGIIHRDLKPDNILLDERNNSYLTDFGLAKNVLSGPTQPRSKQDLEAMLNAQEAFFSQQPQSTLFVTDSDAMTGTPAYLSPEQILGETLSPQSDIYSLGITLYEMLTGHFPYGGASLGEIITKHLQQPLPSIHDQVSSVPKAVDAVVQRATAKKRIHRYTEVLTLAADFRKACGR